MHKATASLGSLISLAGRSAKRISTGVSGAVAGLTLSAKSAFAANGFGQVFSQDVTSQGNPLLQGMLSLSFIGGAGFVIYGILHAIKAHKSEGRDAKMPAAVVMIFAGAALTTISYMLGAGQGTIFSDGGTTAQTATPMTIN